MSTRATYNINGTSFYIHYDGYQEGAAHYFVNMINAFHKPVNEENQIYRTANGGYAEAFLRGNNVASFTSSHEEHTDTEFRYTLNGDNLTVCIRKSWDSDQWKVEKWDLAEFINKYNTWSDDRAINLQLSSYSEKKTLHTTNSIQYVIEDKKRTKKLWESKGHDTGSNYKNLLKELNLILKQVTDILRKAA